VTEFTNQGELPKLSQVIQINEGKIQQQLREVLRGTCRGEVERPLDAEDDRLCRADGYDRSDARERGPNRKSWLGVFYDPTS